MAATPDRMFEGSFLCDYAAEYGGRLTAMGVFLNLVDTQQLPVVHRMMLVSRLAFIGLSEDFEHKFEIKFQVIDPAGSTLFALDAAAVVPAQDLHRDMPPGTNILVPLQVALQVPGVHQVQILLDGSLALSLPFKVILTTPES